MYQYPYGNAQQLNLDWLMEQWQEVKQSIDGSLQGEIDRVEAAITDLLAARDAAVAAAGAANTSAGAAAQSAQAAAADAATATAQAAAATQERVNAAQAANNAQSYAGTAQTQAAAAQNAAGQAAASASQAAADASDAHDDALAASGSAVNAAASAAGALQNFQLSDAARQAAQAAEQDAEAAATLLQPPATSADIGKALIVKTVGGGTVTAYELGESGGGGGGTPAIVQTIEDVAIASFDDGTVNPVQQLIVDIEPVQSGSGDPAPDNVRPITGWTGANVYRTGKNLAFLNEFTIFTENGITLTKNDDGSITVNGTATANFTRTIVSEFKIKNGTYIISGVPANPAGGAFSVWARSGINGDNYSRTYDGHNNTINISNEKIYIYCTITSGVTVNNVKIFIQLETGSTATAFELPKRDIYSITFPAEAGTVYGATLENHGTNEWKLRVDRAKYIGTWGSSGGSDLGTVTRRGFTLPVRADTSDMNNTAGKQICSIAPHAYKYTDDYLHFYVASATTVYMFLPNDTSADTQFEVVYPIETPVEYTFTTAEIITLLAGYNNVWADTGNINLLQYYADSKKYIDEQDALIKALIAPVLDGMIADTALTVNDFRIVNNTLYRITAPVAAEAALTPNTNCTATTIGAVLKTLLT